MERHKNIFWLFRHATHYLVQGSPNYGPGAISSGSRSHFVNDEKNVYEKFVDLAECNTSRNNYIT